MDEAVVWPARPGWARPLLSAWRLTRTEGGAMTPRSIVVRAVPVFVLFTFLFGQGTTAHSQNQRQGPIQGQVAGQDQPVFRAGTTIVPLTVTVLDRNNHPVTDLKQGDFTILEGKVP